MPFRLASEGFPGRAKMQFVTSTRMPRDIYTACVATGTPSNTRYIQEAVCYRLAADLGLDYDALLAELPSTRAALYDPTGNNGSHPQARNRHGIALAPATMVHIGPGNTNEEVK